MRVPPTHDESGKVNEGLEKFEKGRGLTIWNPADSWGFTQLCYMSVKFVVSNVLCLSALDFLLMALKYISSRNR